MKIKVAKVAKVAYSPLFSSFSHPFFHLVKCLGFASPFSSLFVFQKLQKLQKLQVLYTFKSIKKKEILF